MAANQKKVGTNKSEVIADLPLACSNETAAVEFWERHRWGDCPGCVHCGSTNVYKMTDAKSGERNKRYLWRCRDCKKQYTVRVGMVLEDSRIPLSIWCYALWRSCTSKKGVSALEIQRQTGISYKSALFLMHRLKFAMAPTGGGPKFAGTVEADETYVGGKPRYRKRQKRFANPGDGKTSHETIKDRKTPVFGVICRETGEVRTRVMPEVTAVNLREACDELIDKSANLMTDESSAYIKLGREYASHQSVAHSKGEYVRGDVTTNSIEGFWSLLKRGVYGTYHNVSRKHLQRYVDEFEFRYNHRKLEDGERTIAAIRGAEGKKLYYREPVAG